MESNINQNNVPYVDSAKDVEQIFQNMKDKFFPNMTENQFLDYATRIMFFFDHAEEMKLSPETNKDLFSEPEHKKLITVPTEINNYYEYQKGDFVPVCKVKARNPYKAYENDILISVDVKKGVVLARINTQKLIFGKKSDKVVGKECFCVSNYCIPSLYDLVRGKNSDIIHKKSAVKGLGLDYSKDYTNYKLQIAKGVLQLNRMDTDMVHLNEFDVINGYNNEQKKLLKEYFTIKADPPHFHFIYKDYVLYCKEHDGSAMAINSNNLTKYLLDLYYTNTNSNEDILKYNFGMPFVEIKKRKITLKGDTVKNKALNGLCLVYNNLSENEKSLFLQKVRQDIDLKVRNIDKVKNKEDYNRLLKNTEKLTNILSGKEETTEFDKFDALHVFIFETSSISILWELAMNNPKIKSEIINAGNDFYNTIEYIISPSLYKNEYQFKNFDYDK